MREDARLPERSGRSPDVLIIRGVPGFTVEEAQWASGIEALKPCPGIKIVGAIWGKWNPATTKAEVLKFLASHPGQIDLVFADAVAAGVIQAFEQAGRPIPPVNFSGSTGGDLSWWLAHKDTYQTVGYHYSGASVAWTELRILLRVLAGKQPRFRDISIPPARVTNANVAVFATPGKPVTWIGDARVPVDAFGKVLNRFFKAPGGPSGF